MTAHDRDVETDHDEIAAEVIRLVQVCQTRWGAWASVDEPAERQALRDEYRGYLEQLWVLLEPRLRKVAYNWLRSNLAPDVESLTQAMFSYIMDALPRLKLNPNGNPVGYLTTIAWRGCYDDYGRQYDVRRVRRRSPDGAPEGSGEQETTGLRFNEELPTQVADGGEAMADHVIERISKDTILAAVWEFWKSLSFENQQIMRWRSFMEPPRSFKEIAADLGPGWTEVAARKRHSRVMEATRSYLRDLGLLDASPP